MTGSSSPDPKPNGTSLEELVRKGIRNALYSAESYTPLEIEIGLLKDLGWELWSDNLRMAWAEHLVEKVGIGSYPKPKTSSESTETEIKEELRWKHMNSKAITILKRGITSEHDHFIDGLQTAAEMYRVLELHFQKDTEIAAAASISALFKHTWDPDSSTFEENLCYIQGQINLIRRFKGDVDELINLIHSISILNSLPDEWDSVKATLYAMDKIELSVVLRTTKRMHQTGGALNGKGKLKAKEGTSSGGPIRCKNCKKGGHTKADCWAIGGRNEARRTSKR